MWHGCWGMACQRFPIEKDQRTNMTKFTSCASRWGAVILIVCLKLRSLKMWENNFYRTSRLVWSLTWLANLIHTRRRHVNQQFRAHLTCEQCLEAFLQNTAPRKGLSWYQEGSTKTWWALCKFCRRSIGFCYGSWHFDCDLVFDGLPTLQAILLCHSFLGSNLVCAVLFKNT